MKKELRYIRYRICRNIYYADQCPMDNRKNFKEIAKNVGMAFGLGCVCFVVLCVFVLMA